MPLWPRVAASLAFVPWSLRIMVCSFDHHPHMDFLVASSSSSSSHCIRSYLFASICTHKTRLPHLFLCRYFVRGEAKERDCADRSIRCTYAGVIETKLSASQSINLLSAIYRIHIVQSPSPPAFLCLSDWCVECIITVPLIQLLSIIIWESPSTDYVQGQFLPTYLAAPGNSITGSKRRSSPGESSKYHHFSGTSILTPLNET